MSAGRFSLCIAALVSLTLGTGRAEAQTTQPAAEDSTSLAADIQIGKPTRYPILITPLMEGGTLRDNHHGPELIVEEFEFDPNTHELRIAKNTPAGQRLYGNSRIDAAAYNADLNVFKFSTTDRTPIGKILLTCAKKKIQISDNYVVSPAADEPIKIDPSTYCAAVQLVKGNESSKPGTTVKLRRNNEPPTASTDAAYTRISRKTDLITWTIERDGAVIKTGSFGFPVVATEPGLVKYVIDLP
jgi:hypothetical protein